MSFLARVVTGLLCSLVTFTALAHHDGDVGQIRHYYRVSGSGLSWNIYKKTAHEACQLYVQNGLSNYSYSSVSFGGGKWTCSYRYNPTGDIYSNTSWNTDELHCPYEQTLNMAGTACEAHSTNYCASHAMTIFTWDSNRLPVGFNVPTDVSKIPTSQAQFLPFAGCSFKRTSFSTNGECTRVTYTSTGDTHIDEDGLPAALNVGDAFANTLPPVCDPDTGDVEQGPTGDTANVCAQRSGDTVDNIFWSVPWPVPNPTPRPAYACIDGCKAVPKAGEAEVCAGVGETPTTAACLMKGTYPFPDQANFGRCETGSNGGNGSVTDISGSDGDGSSGGG